MFKKKMNAVHRPVSESSAPDRYESVRARLVAAAESTVAQRGLAALKARDLATQAGCALGAIYTAFADMDALILAVNARTQAALDAELAAATAPHARASPATLLCALADAYLDYAAANRGLWDALFAHRMAVGHTAPDWFWDQQAALFARVERPVAELCPGLPDDELRLAARSVFSAVHGVVSLGLDQRVASIDMRGLRKELHRIVRALTAGLPAAAQSRK
jgi:AcrR family transcriptional regulator